ncbi:hypothetical protein HDU98_004901 [Podochytrium sp. JEL0797]|nr:hypothetical protein HDU98_004901 [Podochytrium sp. JEL0797]
MTIDSSVSGSIPSSQPFASQASAGDPGEVIRLHAEIESMRDTIHNLNHTVTTQQAEIDRLMSFHQRRHEDDKIYNKAVKDGLSLRDADRLKTNAPTPSKHKPLPTSASGRPNPTKSLLQIPSKFTAAAVDKKGAVKEILTVTTTTWNGAACRKHKNVKLGSAPHSVTHPQAAAGFKSMFKTETRLKESAINLLRNEYRKTPFSLPTNASIAVSILRSWIDELEPDDPLIEYMHELSTTQSDASMPSFTTLHSMFWAILVSWAGFIKSTLKDTRQELASQNPSTPKEIPSNPKAVDFHDDNPPVPVASNPSRTNFTWRTHSFSRHEVAVSGAGLAFAKSLTNGPIKPTEIENQLSALDQDLLDNKISFHQATHLTLYKTCMMQLMTRLAHLGITTTVAIFVDSFFDGLLALFVTFPFSSYRDEFDSFIDSDSFDCGAASSNVDDVFVALSASADKVSQSVEILQFIVAQIVGDGSFKIGSASRWLKLISKDLALQSHEVHRSNKSNSLDDCIHLLACVFLPHGAIDSLIVSHLEALRLTMNAIIHVMFQRAQAADFWSFWPFKPLGNNHGTFFDKWKVPVFLVARTVTPKTASAAQPPASKTTSKTASAAQHPASTTTSKTDPSNSTTPESRKRPSRSSKPQTKRARIGAKHQLTLDDEN